MYKPTKALHKELTTVCPNTTSDEARLVHMVGSGVIALEIMTLNGKTDTPHFNEVMAATGAAMDQIEQFLVSSKDHQNA